MSHPPLLLGLSGPSSSGKTTLARLLTRIFPHTLLIHEDDFYLPEAQLPLRAGLRDWDCVASLDITGLVDALRYVKRYGKMKEGFKSKEDQNDTGKTGVSEEVVRRLKGEVGEGMERLLVVVDGFLLFGESVAVVREEVDLKVLLRARFEDAKRRRERRSGYVTLEGFWEDPPGYVDKVVWPNYVEEHRFLFEEGDVEGEIRQEVCERLGIRVIPGGWECGMEKCLEWAVGVVKEEMGKEEAVKRKDTEGTDGAG